MRFNPKPPGRPGYTRSTVMFSLCIAIFYAGISTPISTECYSGTPSQKAALVDACSTNAHCFTHLTADRKTMWFIATRPLPSAPNS